MCVYLIYSYEYRGSMEEYTKDIWNLLIQGCGKGDVWLEIIKVIFTYFCIFHLRQYAHTNLVMKEEN